VVGVEDERDTSNPIVMADIILNGVIVGVLQGDTVSLVVRTGIVYEKVMVGGIDD
jgi:hypothetical protein